MKPLSVPLNYNFTATRLKLLVCLYSRSFLANTLVILIGPAWAIYPGQTFQCLAWANCPGWSNCRGWAFKKHLACWLVENQKATPNKLS